MKAEFHQKILFCLCLWIKVLRMISDHGLVMSRHNVVIMITIALLDLPQCLENIDADLTQDSVYSPLSEFCKKPN